jgi:hypothetical protein
MANKIQHRRDTAAQWTTIDPILTSGEWGLETDTGYTKIGDGTTNWNSLSYAIDKVYDIYSSVSGSPSSAQELMRLLVVRPLTIPVDFAGSYAKAGTAATGSSVFSIKKNGSQIATFTFAASGTTATFSTQAAVSFVAGDELTVVGPGSADSSLSNIGWTFLGHYS